MGMTIDEAIEQIIECKAYKQCDTEKDSEAFEVAIDTMRKYQKIEDIYYHQSGQALENSLRAVIEDGKID